MGEQELELYQIRSNRSPFNNVIWHQEKSKRLLGALTRTIDLYLQCDPLKYREGVELEAVTPAEDKEDTIPSPDQRFWFEMEEALHMAFTLYFFAIGRNEGYNDGGADMAAVFDGGTEGLLEVMKQYDEAFQSLTSERYYPTLEVSSDESSLLRRLKKEEGDDE